jgi:hypothetical protein
MTKITDYIETLSWTRIADGIPEGERSVLAATVTGDVHAIETERLRRMVSTARTCGVDCFYEAWMELPKYRPEPPAVQEPESSTHEYLSLLDSPHEVRVQDMDPSLHGYVSLPRPDRVVTMLVWRDDRKKPLLYSAMTGLENAEKYVADKLRSATAAMAFTRDVREKRKLEKKAIDYTAPDSVIKPGAILCRSWGYDQTNVDFYVVLSVTPKTVIMQRCGKKDVGTENSGMSMATYVVPDPKHLLKETIKAVADTATSVRHSGRTYCLTNQTDRHYESWYA